MTAIQQILQQVSHVRFVAEDFSDVCCSQAQLAIGLWTRYYYYVALDPCAVCPFLSARLAAPAVAELRLLQKAFSKGCNGCGASKYSKREVSLDGEMIEGP